MVERVVLLSPVLDEEAVSVGEIGDVVRDGDVVARVDGDAAGEAVVDGVVLDERTEKRVV